MRNRHRVDFSMKGVAGWTVSRRILQGSTVQWPSLPLGDIFAYKISKIDSSAQMLIEFNQNVLTSSWFHNL